VNVADARLSLIDRPEAGTATHPEGLVNRYLVDMVESDLMLGFFFRARAWRGRGRCHRHRPSRAATGQRRRPPPDEARARSGLW